METILKILGIEDVSETPILPMRHGNNCSRFKLLNLNRTPILPMRHGNWSSPRMTLNQKRTPILPMRHGNMLSNGKDQPFLYLLRSYLWGMETRLNISFIGFDVSLLRSYLWGMETNMGRPNMRIPWRLRSYLWGMETCVIDDYGTNVTYSDPTYEAWKLGNQSQINNDTLTPILPMRHGNLLSRNITSGE